MWQALRGPLAFLLSSGLSGHEKPLSNLMVDPKVNASTRFIAKAVTIPFALTVALTFLELRTSRQQARLFPTAAGRSVGAESVSLDWKKLWVFMSSGYKSQVAKMLPSALKNQLAEHEYQILFSALLGLFSTALTLPYQTRRALISIGHQLEPKMKTLDLLRLARSGLNVRLLEGQIFSAATFIVAGWLSSQLQQWTQHKEFSTITSLLGMSTAGAVVGFLTTPLNTFAKAMITATKINVDATGRFIFEPAAARQVLQGMLELARTKGLFSGGIGHALRAGFIFLFAEFLNTQVDLRLNAFLLPAEEKAAVRLIRQVLPQAPLVSKVQEEKSVNSLVSISPTCQPLPLLGIAVVLAESNGFLHEQTLTATPVKQAETAVVLDASTAFTDSGDTVSDEGELGDIFLEPTFFTELGVPQEAAQSPPPRPVRESAPGQTPESLPKRLSRLQGAQPGASSPATIASASNTPTPLTGVLLPLAFSPPASPERAKGASPAHPVTIRTRGVFHKPPQLSQVQLPTFEIGLNARAVSISRPII